MSQFILIYLIMIKSKAIRKVTFEPSLYYIYIYISVGTYSALSVEAVKYTDSVSANG